MVITNESKIASTILTFLGNNILLDNSNFSPSWQHDRSICHVETKPRFEPEDNNYLILTSWLHSTSYILLHSTAPFSILDRVFPMKFPKNLKDEITSRGLLDNLSLAHTVYDHTHSFLNSAVRNDESKFISQEYRSSREFRMNYPNFDVLISCVERTILHHLSTYIHFDKKLSVQISSYEGDGKCGYVRHIDRSHNSLPRRIITAIYYLTDKYWNAENGGYLRIYSGDDYDDILPIENRLVIFRSDIVEHEVTVSYRKRRLAICIWFYGEIK